MNLEEKKRNFRLPCKRFLVMLIFLIISSDQCYSQSNEELIQKELIAAKETSDWKARIQHLKNAMTFINSKKQTVIEKGNFNYSLATISTQDIKELGLTDEQKSNIAKEAIPHFEKAKNNYKEHIVSHKKSFKDFMNKLYDDKKGTFLKSKECKESINTIYAPYVIAQMRYFECVVEKNQFNT